MKFYIKSYLPAILVAFAASAVFGSSLFVPPSVKSTSMGYSFVAVADDLSAIYWNPAGLTQLGDSGYSVGFTFINGASKGNQPLKNSPVPNAKDGDFPYLGQVYPTEPSQYASKDLKIDSTLPFIAGYKKVKDITLAFGIYAAGGGGGIYESRQVDSAGNNLLGSVNALQGFLIGNVSAAKDITDRLSVGIGFDLVYMIDNAEVKKQFTSAISGINSYYESIDQSASGTGFQVNVGCLYKIIPDKLKFGLAIRSGAAINMTGKSTFKLTGLSLLGVPDANSQTDYDERYAYPVTGTAGFSYKPSLPWTIALSIMQENYSVLRNDFEYKNQTYFPNVKTSQRCHDNTLYCFGAEYKANEKFAYRAGLLVDPNQFPEDQLTQLNPNQYMLIVPNVGLGYSFKDYQINADYSYFISKAPSLDGRSYEYAGGTAMVNLSRKF
jgi:long-chain fatty acid transport protein